MEPTRIHPEFSGVTTQEQPIRRRMSELLVEENRERVLQAQFYNPYTSREECTKKEGAFTQLLSELLASQNVEDEWELDILFIFEFFLFSRIGKRGVYISKKEAIREIDIYSDEYLDFSVNPDDYPEPSAFARRFFGFFPVWVLYRKTLSDTETSELIAKLQTLYEEFEFSHWHYQKLGKENPFNTLLDRITLLILKLDSVKLPEKLPEGVSIQKGSNTFQGPEDNEFYKTGYWYTWFNNEPFLVANPDCGIDLQGKEVSFLISHRVIDPFVSKSHFSVNTGFLLPHLLENDK